MAAQTVANGMQLVILDLPAAGASLLLGDLILPDFGILSDDACYGVGV